LVLFFLIEGVTMQLKYNLFNKIKLGNTSLFILIAAVIGILSGFCNLIFVWVTELSHKFFFEFIGNNLLHIDKGGWHALLIPIILIAGALILIPLSLSFPGLVNGYGFPKFLEEIHLKMSKISSKRLFANTFAAAITIGSGGSAGREGPIAQIGGTIGSLVSRAFNFSVKRTKVLIGCGVAGAIAATFNAPIAGVLFAEEIVFLGELKLNTFSLFVISSVAGTAVSRIFNGSQSIFHAPHYQLKSMHELSLYFIMAIIIGIVSSLYIKFYYSIKRLFKKLTLHKQGKPIIGALMVGSIGILIPQILGDGYHIIQEMIGNKAISYSIVFLLFLFLIKIAATSLTIGSGGAGGMFAPSLFIGAVLGRLCGEIFAIALPAMHISPEAYAVVGMGALLAATTHAPMTAIFLLIEITASYDVILPILLTSIIGTIISQKLSPESIDTKYFSENKIIIEGAKEASLLKFHRVSEIMKKGNFTAPENLNLEKFIDVIENDSPTNFPIVNSKGEITGILNLNSLKSFIFREDLWQLLLVSDMTIEDFPYSFENEDLFSVLEKFDKSEVDDMPVITDDKKVTGIISRSALMSFLRKQMIAYNQHEAPISEL